METREFIQGMLERLKQSATRAANSLTPQELAWQPGKECNSIGLLLFHMARSEDSFVQSRMREKPQVWESEQWYQKLNMPLSLSGSGFTAEQVTDFPVPELTSLMAYAEAVRAQTQQYVKTMADDELNRTVNMGRMGDITIAGVLTVMMLHLAQHCGEMSYLRGMQRGMNK